jgi:hypothetical protein
MKPFLRLLLAFPLLVFAATELAAQAKLRETPYYPLRVGTIWHYRAGDGKFTIQVARHEKVGETLCAVLETKRNGKVVGSEHLAVASDGIYRHTLTLPSSSAKPENEKNQLTIKPPLLLLKLPPEEGDSWKIGSKADDKTFRGSFEVGEQEITVPAGTYKTTRVTSQDLEVNALKAGITTFYAEGVGMVKQIIEVGDVKVEIELEKFIVASSQ